MPASSIGQPKEVIMSNQYKFLGTVLALGEFSVADLAALSGLQEKDVRYALRKNRRYVEKVGKQSTGLPGGQPALWRIRPEARESLLEQLRKMERAGATPWFGKKQQDVIRAELIAADDVLLRAIPATTDSEEQVDLIKLARARLDVAAAFIPPISTADRSNSSSVRQRELKLLGLAEAVLDMIQFEQSLQEDAQQSDDKNADPNDVSPADVEGYSIAPAEPAIKNSEAEPRPADGETANSSKPTQAPFGDNSSYEARHDAQLVAAIAAGDEGAPVVELYRRYATRLFRFGMQQLGDPGLAEELVQECFLRLWRTASRFDEQETSVGTYLFVLARSVASDIRKRPSSRPLLPIEGNAIPSLPDRTDQALDQIMIRNAVRALSPAHQDVIKLMIEGFTQTQIAERLGLPLGTVKTRTFYAMRALRSVLAEEGFPL